MELKSKTSLSNGLTRHLFSDGSYVDYAADGPPAMSDSEKKQFDEMSARSWRDQELRKLEETRAEAAFEAEDNYLESIKAEGELRSKGVE